MGKKLMCYHCFERFAPHQVWFRCDNHWPKDETGACPLEEDRKFKKGPMRHAFPYVHNFTQGLISLFNRLPRKCKCDKCGYVSKTRICPSCHRLLPFEAGEIDEHIIAVIGSPGSGKSHYFAVLIERCLKGHVGEDFVVDIMSADDETEDIFIKKYRMPLFENKIEIPPNRPEDRADDRLRFRLTFRYPISLIFYDISGELLNTREDITNASRFLFHSSGIIYLVNPLHLPTCKEKLADHGDEIPSIYPDTILGNAIHEIRKDRSLKPKAKLNIPLAVCISQSDRIRDNNGAFDFDERIFKPHYHKGKFDFQDFQKVDGEISSQVQDWRGESANLFRMAKKHFKTCGFFMFSALGCSPQEGRIDTIAPIRLEDPFLWILSQIGIIKTS